MKEAFLQITAFAFTDDILLTLVEYLLQYGILIGCRGFISGNFEDNFISL